MIKRLKLLGTSGVQKKLSECKIDKTHEIVSFSIFSDFIQYLSNQRNSKELFDKMHKNLSTQSNILKIKSLIVLHYLVKKTFNKKVIDFVHQQCSIFQNKFAHSIKSMQQRQKQITETVKLQNQQKQYIQKNIIQFYIIYLKKFISYQQSYQFAKQEDESAKKQKQSNFTLTKFKDQTYFLQCINHGFKILNLINFVLQSQESFNKMGRYYIQHYQIVSLFVMYLSDLTIYNGFIKNLSKKIVKFINQLESPRLKHCFLFLTQAQKISDQLYQFHYNRYYYSIIKKFIMMPTFLTLQNQEFDKVAKEIKKVDKQLFLLVKESKYSNNQSRLNQTCLTQKSRGRQQTFDRHNQTMMTQVSHRNSQVSSQWENITKYIQEVQEIDQKQQYI